MSLPVLPLLLVLVVAWLAGRTAERIGYPSVLGELVAGMLFGPPLLGWLTGHPALDVLGQVGILLMMAYIGMEIDPAELGRASKSGFFAAIGGFVTPFVLCYLLVVGSGGTPLAGLFVGMAAGVTSLATKSRILLDLRILDTRVASVLMAGALVADTLSLILFAGIMGVAETGAVDPTALALVTGKAVAFFVAAGALGYWGLPPLGRLLTRRGPLSANAAFIVAVLLTLAFAEGAELAGMHGILGAFVAGLFLRDRLFGRTLTRTLEEGLRQASLGFLAPVFFVTAGFAVSPEVLIDSPLLVLGVVGLATLGKIIGTALFYLPTGHGWREGLVIGGGMNGRGAVEIIIAQIGLAGGLITQEIFSVLVFMAIATTATVPVLLRLGVRWLENRNELVRTQDRRKGTLVVGAGPTARAYAAALLAQDGAGSVMLLDRNTDACAAARMAGLPVVEGDALDDEILDEAGATRVRTLAALTPNPEVNALVARTARREFRIPSILVHFEGRDAAGHRELIRHIGGDTLFGTAVHLADWDYWFDNGMARFETEAGRLRPVRLDVDPAPEVGDFLVHLAGAPIRDLALPADRPERDGATGEKALFDAAASVLTGVLGRPATSLALAFADREATGSTVIDEGIAVPHARLSGSGRFAMAFFRSREGLVFPDAASPVHAAFVIATSDDRRNEYLRTLAAIARIVSVPDFMEQWLAAPDAEALRSLLSELARVKSAT